MIQRIASLLTICLFFSSCGSHVIVRTGYHAAKSDYVACDVLISKERALVADSLVTKVGEIELIKSETGAGICNERRAVKILRGEACAINADLVVVVEERRPDFWNKCYGCRAKFYQFDSAHVALDLSGDEYYSAEEVERRVDNDMSILALKALGGFAIGFLFGFFFL